MSLMQRTLATLEEYTDFSVPTVMSIIMELKMSGTIFQDWMKDTSSMKQPPSAKHMLDFVERYQRGLAATGTPVQPANKSHIPVKKPYKPPPVFHMRVSSGCKLCSGEDHVLHQCPDLRNMTVEQRHSTSHAATAWEQTTQLETAPAKGPAGPVVGDITASYIEQMLHNNLNHPHLRQLHQPGWSPTYPLPTVYATRLLGQWP